MVKSYITSVKPGSISAAFIPTPVFSHPEISWSLFPCIWCFTFSIWLSSAHDFNSFFSSLSYCLALLLVMKDCSKKYCSGESFCYKNSGIFRSFVVRPHPIYSEYISVSWHSAIYCKEYCVIIKAKTAYQSSVSQDECMLDFGNLRLGSKTEFPFHLLAR